MIEIISIILSVLLIIVVMILARMFNKIFMELKYNKEKLLENERNESGIAKSGIFNHQRSWYLSLVVAGAIKAALVGTIRIGTD